MMLWCSFKNLTLPTLVHTTHKLIFYSHTNPSHG